MGEEKLCLLAVKQTCYSSGDLGKLQYCFTSDNALRKRSRGGGNVEYWRRGSNTSIPEKERESGEKRNGM